MGIGYKLFKVKASQKGKLFPLYVLADKETPIGVWLKAEEGTKSSDGSHVKSKLGDLCYRPGWHLSDYPLATHIGAKDKNGNELQTMLEYFAERNKLTGLVTTSFFSDATPAAFGAHVDDRSETAKIAKGFIDNGINVLMGGGTSKFSYALMSYAKRNGYEYVTDRNTLLGFDGEKLIGLFASNYMSYENDRPTTEPSIAEMTEKAIDLLSGNEDGFFIMVEAGNIDHAGHSNLL